MGNQWKAQFGKLPMWPAKLKLDNLCAIIDINRLGQSDPTMLEHNLPAYKARWEGFGWHTISPSMDMTMLTC